jgi:hypothetical protein
MARKIAILGGTGPEGSGLANRLARAGEHIVIGSRDAGRAQETAQQLRNQIGGAAKIEGTDNAAAATLCEIAVLTLPFAGQAPLLKQLKGVWKPGTVVIDTTVPLAATVGGSPTRMIGVWQGSAAQAAAELLPADVSIARRTSRLRCARVQRRRQREESGHGVGGENSWSARAEWRRAGERAHRGIDYCCIDRTQHTLQGA